MSESTTPYDAGPVNISQVAGSPVPSTATSIQIGNSDDRLTQREWCDFINATMKIMRRYRIWFSGPSEARAPWQCFCWVIDGKLTPGDEWEMRVLADEYRQNQIAMTVGATVMLTPPDRDLGGNAQTRAALDRIKRDRANARVTVYPAPEKIAYSPAPTYPSSVP